MNGIQMIKQPENLKVNLYPHQLASVYSLEKLEEEKRVKTDDGYIKTDMGIFADITGYGKTLSIVALILRDKMKWDIEKDNISFKYTPFSSQHIWYQQKIKQKRINTTIVLANNSVCGQWVKEFSHTNLKVLKVSTKKMVKEVEAYEYDVIVITISMFNQFIERYHRVVWKRFIFDEPSNIRVPAMREINAGFMWFVTATPNGIIRKHWNASTSYMNKLFKSYNIAYLQIILENITVKNDDEFVKESFEMPPTHHEYHKCYCPLYNTVNGLIDDKLQSMIEAGNISGAIHSLGGKNTDSIVELVKGNKKIELEEIQSKIKIWKLRNDKKKIEQWKEREKKVLEKLEILEKRFESVLNSNCPICQDVLVKPVMEPGCQNVFCGKCILTWLTKKNTCPLCRCSVDRNNLVCIINDKSDEKFKTEHVIPTKEHVIVELVKNGGKFIIFSNYDETFDKIKKCFDENSIKCAIVKGNLQNCEKTLEKFRNGKINTLFLNSKFDSSGINLQETTDIILYHQMNESLQTQIIGRANRIGRKIPLTVHYLEV